MTETEQAAYDRGVFQAHGDDLEIVITMNRSVEATVVKLADTRRENIRLRAHRWSWFLAALAGWTVAAVGWIGLWYVTRIP